MGTARIGDMGMGTLATTGAAARCSDDEQIDALWVEYKEKKDFAARQRLVDLYYPLVKHVARRLAPMLSSQIGIDDLEGYGSLGLIDAVDRYDPNRGVQFSTFAVHRIRGAVYDGIRGADWVPRSVRQKTRAIDDSRAELYSAFGRAPTEDEEARALGLTVEALRAGKALAAAVRVSSLDYEGDAGTPTDVGGTAEEPLTLYLERETRELMRAAMERLPERERTVAQMSFFNELTLAQIGASLGVTESRVSQIRTSALKRLRTYMQAAAVVASRTQPAGASAGMAKAANAS